MGKTNTKNYKISTGPFAKRQANNQIITQKRDETDKHFATISIPTIHFIGQNIAKIHEVPLENMGKTNSKSYKISTKPFPKTRGKQPKS